MKNIFILMLGLVIRTSTQAQETIPMPTQDQWDAYVDGRMKNILKLLFEGGLSQNIDAYITNQFSDSSNSKLSKESVSYQFLTFYDFFDSINSSPEMLIYKTVEVPLNIDSLNGYLSFSLTSEIINGQVSKINTGVAITQEFNLKSKYKHYTRSGSGLGALWFKAQKLDQILSEADISFIHKLFEVYAPVSSCYDTLKPETIFANSILEHPETISFKKGNKLILKSLPQSLAYILDDIDGVLLFDNQRKIIKTKYELFAKDYVKQENIDVIDEKESTPEEPVFKTMSIAAATNFSTIDSISFNVSGKIIQFMFIVNSDGYKLNFKDKTKASKYTFSMNAKAIEANNGLSKITWWLEDYYRWVNTKK